MTHREIWHEIHINASLKQVYGALTEVRKLARWWTTDTRGKSAVGGKLGFWFYGHFSAEMIVTELKADKLMRWRVTRRGIPDWADTEIEFKLFRVGGETYLHLRHSKWREDAEMFPECRSRGRKAVRRFGRRRTGANAAGQYLFFQTLWHGLRPFWRFMDGHCAAVRFVPPGLRQMREAKNHRSDCKWICSRWRLPTRHLRPKMEVH